MKLGFTGTAQGMSQQQKKMFRAFVVDSKITEFHHGDCVGADDEATNIIGEESSSTIIHAWPCNISSMRAYNAFNHIIHPIRAPLLRNKDIVKSSEKMIATPKELQEITRSGTWATVRESVKRKKFLLMIYPNGKTEIRGGV